MEIRVHTKVLLVRPDGCILVIKRSLDDDRRAGEWDFPGGGAKAGENPTVAAVREVREEVGIQLEPEDVVLFYAATEPYADDDISNTRIMFIAHVNKVSDAVVLSHEHIDFIWQQPQETVKDFPHPVYVKGLQYALEHRLLN